jgi:hypothetical protein
MGFDTECDLAVEATGTSATQMKLRHTIVAVRDNFLCEHLGVEPQKLAAALSAGSGSVLKAIDALHSSGRTLVPFDRATIKDDESLLAENDLLDPEIMPTNFNWRLAEKFAGIPSMFRPGKPSRQH